MKSRMTVAAVGVLSLAMLASACGSDDKKETSASGAPAESTAPAGSTASAGSDAAGAVTCPKKLTIQTDWFPELEHGGTYQLIGAGGTASKDTVSYFGKVQPQYAVGGLEEIEITTVKFGTKNSAILQSGKADMAYITASDIIADSAAVDMVAIMKTLEKDPQMIMWDPTQLKIDKPADIKATGAKVLHFPGTSYIDFMIGQGMMDKSQSDPSYDGSDAKWVKDAGNYVQQGFATNEVYKYEKEVKWKNGAPADVSYFTVSDLGFDNYPATITMMKSKAKELDGCLKALVPKMAQAWVDFLKDPKPITDKMIEINKVHAGFWGLSEALNTDGMALVEAGNFAVNSKDGTYCSFDLDRTKKLYDQLKPIYDAQKVKIADSVDGLFTNDYCKGAPGR